MIVGARVSQPRAVMCPAVVINLVATFLPQHYRHRLSTFRTEHSGPEQCLDLPALLAPTAASLSEIAVGSYPLLFCDEHGYLVRHLLAVRLRSYERSLDT